MEHYISARSPETSAATMILRSMVGCGDKRGGTPGATSKGVRPFPHLLDSAPAAVGAASDASTLSRRHASPPARATRHRTARP
ncbi:hypothetical protein Acidovoranil_16150 [Acidovorax sp. FG27]